MFGTFQGRLSKPPGNQLQWFPQDCWQEEFYKCEKLNLDFIELLDERLHYFLAQRPFCNDPLVKFLQREIK